MDAIFLYSACILLGGIAAGLTTGALLWRFGQRCTKLEWAVGDIQDRLSSFKGKELAARRWEKRDTLDAQMEEALKHSAPISTKAARKYDNDPLGME